MYLLPHVVLVPTVSHAFLQILKAYKWRTTTRYWESIWKVRVPPCVLFFPWCAVLEMLTIDNLRRWGLILMDWCFMCKNHWESVVHLFLHCAMAWELWSLFSVCLESIGYTFFSLKMFPGWKGCFGKRSNGEIWIAIPLGLMLWL